MSAHARLYPLSSAMVPTAVYTEVGGSDEPIQPYSAPPWRLRRPHYDLPGPIVFPFKSGERRQPKRSVAHDLIERRRRDIDEQEQRLHAASAGNGTPDLPTVVNRAILHENTVIRILFGYPECIQADCQCWSTSTAGKSPG
jgi:hypothetical protein